MEINKENVGEVLKSEAFKTELLSLITESDTIKSVIDNKADVIYKAKIGTEVQTMYSKIDDDIFEKLGERPIQKEDGNREKTYDFVKRIAGELKGYKRHFKQRRGSDQT